MSLESSALILSMAEPMLREILTLLLTPNPKRPGDVPGNGWRNWLDKAYTWMQGSHPDLGETPFCGRPESRSQPLLLFRWPGGGAHVEGQASILASASPTPSSKTERAVGGASRTGLQLGGGGGSYLCKCQSPLKKKRNAKLVPSAQSSNWICLGPEIMSSYSLGSTPCRGALTPPPPLPRPAWRRQEVVTQWPWHSQLLVTSLLPNQLVLSGSTFKLKG